MYIGEKTRLHFEAGTTLLEVLITIVILAFGLLGLAGLQAKIQLSEVESYQRAEALVLLSDMVERMQNFDSDKKYTISGSTCTVSDASGVVTPTDSAVLTTLSTRCTSELTEWKTALQGAAEKKGGTSVGAMTNANGCITRIQDPIVRTCASGNTANVPGIYLVTLTWSGMHQTATPSKSCTGDTVNSYLRSISTRVSLGIPSCS